MGQTPLATTPYSTVASLYVLYELFFFIDNVVHAAFLCKHVRLSRVFYNKPTYLLNPSVL